MGLLRQSPAVVQLRTLPSLDFVWLSIVFPTLIFLLSELERSVAVPTSTRVTEDHHIGSDTQQCTT
jgi:hypothetical protein